MNTRRLRSVVAAAALALLSLLSAGCATTAMKGTPFFTGEYEKREGPPQDRVNIWPLMYYRHPALSIAWPVIEHVSGEQFAIRPLFSVYNLGKKNGREWNFLWPLGQVYEGNNTGRFFPVFWSDDYFHIFPLYWHYGGANGLDALLPLWWFRRAGEEHWSLHLLLGLAGFKNDARASGGYLFPLYGHFKYKTGAKGGYFLWPLGMADRSADGADWHNQFLPLWYIRNSPFSSKFLSLIWSAGSDRSGNDWRLLLPLFYSGAGTDRHAFYTLLGGYSTNSTGSRWAVPLLLSWGSSKLDGRCSNWVLGPLAHWGRDVGETSRHVFPFFYASTNASMSRFYSLPWISTRSADGAYRSSWLLGPLAHWGHADKESSSHVFPLFYASTNVWGRRFYSLPWTSVSSVDGRSWQLLPPVYFHSRDAAGQLTITPLYAAGSSAQSSNSWSALVPLYLSQRDAESRLIATPLGGYSSHRDGSGHKWMVYPLLTWSGRHGTTNNLWAVAPLAHFWSDGRTRRSHVAPLYYWNGKTGTFVSLLAARWKDGDMKRTAVPLLLSWMNRREGRTDTWIAAGLARISRGVKAGASYVIPFFYRNPRTGVVASPVYAKWGSGEDAGGAIPPLLAWITHEHGRTDTWLLAGLARISRGVNASSSYLFPLFFHNPRTGVVASPFYARWMTEGKTTRAVPLLLAGKTVGDRTSEFWALLGLYSQVHEDGKLLRNDFLPLYMYERGERFFSLLFGWTHGPRRVVYFLTPLVGLRTGDTGGGWIFPLYNRKVNKSTGETWTRFLWGFHRSSSNHSRSVFFPLYGFTGFGPKSRLDRATTSGRAGTDFFCIPYCWSVNTRIAERDPRTREMVVRDEVSHGAFPLWSYDSERAPAVGRERSSCSILLRFYDQMHERYPDQKAGGGSNDYVRKRLLWRVWHYERLNGDVSVDALPAITWDRKKDGYHKFSFLWHFVRWERDAQGRHKFDLFFIPLMRQK